MYRHLRDSYWCGDAEENIVNFISKCLTCQQVKVGHLTHAGLLRNIEINKWKWEHIAMDSVTDLPRTKSTYDSSWVIFEGFTKTLHIIPVKSNHSTEQYARTYIGEIMRLNGVLVSIISDQGSQFTCRFWRSLQESLRNKSFKYFISSSNWWTVRANHIDTRRYVESLHCGFQRW